jgi:hypothetical protein
MVDFDISSVGGVGLSLARLPFCQSSHDMPIGQSFSPAGSIRNASYIVSSWRGDVDAGLDDRHLARQRRKLHQRTFVGADSG